MIRLALSTLGGVALALSLFWLLALLVTPPTEEVAPPEMAVPLRLASVTEAAEEAETASVPVVDHEASGEEPVETVPAERKLVPETLEGIGLPEPEPEPEPAPEPAPEPTPEPRPGPAPPLEPASVPREMPRAEPVSEPGRAESRAEPAVADSGPVEVGEVEPLSRVPPSYPRRAQRRGLEGHVELEFLIRPDGSVDRSSIRVLDARPRRVFEEAAEQAVQQWRFEADGRQRRARQRLEFQLR